MENISTLSSSSVQYYVTSRKWLSDLEFFKIETAFLHRLLDEHFTPLSDQTYILKLRQVGKRLLNLEKDEKEAHQLIKDQLKRVELISENLIPEIKEALPVAQAELEITMTKLTAEYREVKKELFRLVECVMHKNKFLLS
ncbi:hypothetical protein [Mucilaginibacter paludis]|uniref:Uncharacterized protein n=1 Tax=Mucilaginibacter paludis DSM 18603 TaxID=714943 RepID=H1YBC1_9SPHI|nr:hypothetical protein [Mucilaginibacter paludis]EHQ31175.1 hypothetical protein Mucpa_7132 [Mucilaginibacter paludis DSM 18603]